MTSKKSSAKPLIRAPLDTKSVIHAAVTLADDVCLQHLSMRNLGHPQVSDSVALLTPFSTKDSLFSVMC